MMTSNSGDAALARPTRSTLPQTREFIDSMARGWEAVATDLPAERSGAMYAAARRARLGALHPDVTLVIPAGERTQRSNDCNYPFRAHSSFAHLTAWGSDSVPGSVLILSPVGDPERTHAATLYVPAAPGRDDPAFFSDSTVGEFWTGPRPTLVQVAADLALDTRSIEELPAALVAAGADCAVVAEADPSFADRLSRDGVESLAADAVLARDVAELRLVKDAWEIEQMQAAVDATARGFDDIVADLPRSRAHPRGERLVEGVFTTRARLEGNDVGYATIAAAGAHATVLHWERNDGPVRPGELLLVDAGVEMDSYYTADVTRTIPVDGTFNPVQRQVYSAVLKAADAAFTVTQPGVRFRDVHEAAMAVIAQHVAEWGLIDMDIEEALDWNNQPHRRYMVHGTSHHLGLDVHDCSKARAELNQAGILEAGMIITIEPGLYFQSWDLTVPPEFRGIGVRIEDDILVTVDGAVNLSAAIPRTIEDVEEWTRRGGRRTLHPPDATPAGGAR